MQVLKDVLVVDLDSEKWPGLAEFFSRKEVGDTLRVRDAEFTLAEKGDGTAVLNIENIAFSVSRAAKPAKADEDEPKEAPAVRVLRGKREEAVSDDSET